MCPVASIVYTHKYTHTYTSAHTSTHKYTSAHTSTHNYTSAHTSTHIHTYTCTDTYTHKHTHALLCRWACTLRHARAGLCSRACLRMSSTCTLQLLQMQMNPRGARTVQVCMCDNIFPLRPIATDDDGGAVEWVCVLVCAGWYAWEFIRYLTNNCRARSLRPAPCLLWWSLPLWCTAFPYIYFMR
jgi:hypothetical protein